MSHFPRPETDPDTILEPNKRYYGRFWCVDCKRHWTSGNSWLGSGQDCTRCGELTYPYKLSFLKRPDGTDRIEKPHPQEKCERCQKLGYCCRSSEGVQIGMQNRGRIVQEGTQESTQERAQKRNQEKVLELIQKLNQDLAQTQTQALYNLRAHELAMQRSLERDQELIQEWNQEKELALKRKVERAQKRSQELIQERTLRTRPNLNEPSALVAFVGLFILLILAYFIYRLCP